MNGHLYTLEIAKLMTNLLLILLLLVGCSPTEPENVHGCLDSQACNYNSDATIDNNSCWYSNDNCTCDDEQGSEIDMCGVCDTDTTNNCVQDECGVWGGSGVDADNDGTCDDIDECVGEYDCAGECNGDYVCDFYDIINNCGEELGDSIPCNGEYDLSSESASLCPLYEQSVTTTGVVVDYFDITPFNGPHSFTIEDDNGYRLDFIVWPQSSSFQDGFDISSHPTLSSLIQVPFGESVIITGELGAYCNNNQILDIYNEWQITVEYDYNITIISND